MERERERERERENILRAAAPLLPDVHPSATETFCPCVLHTVDHARVSESPKSSPFRHDIKRELLPSIPVLGGPSAAGRDKLNWKHNNVWVFLHRQTPPSSSSRADSFFRSLDPPVCVFMCVHTHTYNTSNSGYSNGHNSNTWPRVHNFL